MSLRTAVVAAALLFFLGRAASAWSPGGHQQIADIAFTKLSQPARQKIRLILFAGDPGFQPHDNSDAELRRAFRDAATFPDFIKYNYSTSYESIIDHENQTFSIDPDTAANEKIRCKTWHYYDEPIRYLPNAKPKVNGSNALVALTRAREKLRSLASANADLHTQAWYLYWIEHVVGDLHQPLHCSSSFEFDPQGDAGGNKFKLAIKNGNTSKNLHSLWDSGIDHAAGSSAVGDHVAEVTDTWTRDAGIQPTAVEVANLDVLSWITAGAKMADDFVYKDIRQDGTSDAAYMVREDLISRRQAVLAGYRLAAILNQILGS